ncbi:MAG: OsmC family protein [Bacteroidota bacterium]
MTTATIASTNYTVSLQNGRHEFLSDEPVEKGGVDAGPAPDELLEASLASCTAVTLRMYAERKKWPVAEIEVTVTLERIEKKTVFTKSIKVNGEIDDTQKQRLLEIAELCPVSRTLRGDIEIKGNIS